MKLLIGKKQFQKYLSLEGTYKGNIDGIIGPKSQQAAIDLVIRDNAGPEDGWDTLRYILAATQMLFQDLGILNGRVDGLYGPDTKHAQEQYQNLMRDPPDSLNTPVNTTSVQWPTYNEMQRFYGPVGKNISLFKLPYPMKLAWDLSKTVRKISLHNKCGQSAIGVMEAAQDHYGAEQIEAMNLHLFGGSLNVRKMRGGNKWSTHSWAAAIDFDPSNNQFRWTDARASLDANAYDKWWELWEAEGWVSLGRERNYDWMHVQAVRL